MRKERTNDQQENLMFSGSVPKLIVKMTIPILIGMSSQLINSIVDTLFISKIDISDASLIGGTSLLFPVIFFVYSICTGVTSGIGSLISRSIGEKNRIFSDKVIKVSLLLGVTLSVVFLTVAILFKAQILGLFNAEESFYSNASIYYSALLPTFFCMLIIASTNGIFQGYGLTSCFMITALTSNLLNIILDPIFIFGFNWGIKGGGIATSSANAIASILSIFFVFKKIKIINKKIPQLNEIFKITKQIFKIGIPQMLRMLTLTFFFAFNTKLLIKIDSLALTAITLCGRIEQIIMLPAHAMGFVILTIVGQNVGRKLFKRVGKIIYNSYFIGFSVLLFLSFIVLMFNKPIFTSFSDNPTILDYCRINFKILLFSYPFFIFSVVTESFYQAIGKPLPSLGLMVFRIVIVYMPLALFFINILNLAIYGIWYAAFISSTSCGIVDAIIVNITLKKMKKGKMNIAVQQ